MALWGVVYPPGQMEVRLEWGEGDQEEVVVRRKGKPDIFLKTALQTVVYKLWPAVLPQDYGG
jgi:hypothetical protein